MNSSNQAFFSYVGDLGTKIWICSMHRSYNYGMTKRKVVFIYLTHLDNNVGYCDVSESSLARRKYQKRFLLNYVDHSKRLTYICLQRCTITLDMNKSKQNSIQIFQSLYRQDLHLFNDSRSQLKYILRRKMMSNYLSQLWEIDSTIEK
jgi:hypothetical protein